MICHFKLRQYFVFLCENVNLTCIDDCHVRCTDCNSSTFFCAKGTCTLWCNDGCTNLHLVGRWNFDGVSPFEELDCEDCELVCRPGDCSRSSLNCIGGICGLSCSAFDNCLGLELQGTWTVQQNDLFRGQVDCPKECGFICEGSCSAELSCGSEMTCFFICNTPGGCDDVDRDGNWISDFEPSISPTRPVLPTNTPTIVPSK